MPQQKTKNKSCQLNYVGGKNTVGVNSKQNIELTLILIDQWRIGSNCQFNLVWIEVD